MFQKNRNLRQERLLPAENKTKEELGRTLEKKKEEIFERVAPT